MRYTVLTSMALGASLSAATGYAACIKHYETVVRGRLAHCESSQFHWDAAQVDRQIEEMLARSLSYRDPRFHDEVRRRWREQQALPGMRRPQTSLVAVVQVQWQASTLAPWQPEASEPVEIRDEPREFFEMVRYLWLGPPEACEDTKNWPYVDLWVTGSCCDTPDTPGEDGCLLRMSYAAPAPAPMRDALAKALDGR